MCLDLVGILHFTNYFASWIPTLKGLVSGLQVSQGKPPSDFVTSIGLSGFPGTGFGSEGDAQLGN